MSDRWWEGSAPVANGASSDEWWREAAEVAPPRRPSATLLPPTSARPTGQAHDGDTFRLDSGQNARLYGYDAFELDQQGRAPDGSMIPLGGNSRTALLPYLPGFTAKVAGKPSYGRPVMSLSNGGVDPVIPLLQGGNGLAAPEYLVGDSPLLRPYMEAERFARQNRRGAFGTTFATPKAARQGNGEPWKQAEAGNAQNGQAVFWDDPTPMQGLRPEIASQLERLWADRSVTPAQLNAFAASKGFALDPKGIEARQKPNARPGGKTQYSQPPRLLTDVGDGGFGAAVRGFADPINMLDELGAVSDSLTGVGGRESVWNSNRRFGDILHNNLEQNRSILANDDANYYWQRFGGQMASGLIAPGSSIEGVGLNAARTALRSGASRFAAVRAAEEAVRRRLAIVGGIEGGLAGAGQGETTGQRLGGAAIGGTAGSVLGVATGYGLPAAGRYLSSRFRRGLADAEPDPAAHQFVNGAGDTAQADAEDYALGAAPTFSGDAPAMPAGSAAGRAAPEYDGNWWEAAEPVAAPDARAAERRVIVEEAQQASQRAYLQKQQAYVDQRMATVAQDDGAPLGPAFDDAANDDDLADLAANAGDAAYAKRQTQLADAFARQFQRDNPYDGSLSDDVVARLKAHDAETAQVKGAWWEEATPVAPMASDIDQPIIYGPDLGAPQAAPGSRVRDYLDLQQPRRFADGPTDQQRMQAVQSLNPRDVLPQPANTVNSLDEAMRIDAGRISPVRAPDEMKALESRSIPSPIDGSRTMPKRGPLDLVTWLRTQGGIKAQGGELEHAGIDNAPRKGLDFAGGEGRFGKLVSNEGMTYDDAALRAWEAGYFPDHADRPTPAEFLDALTQTHNGNARRFRLDDEGEISDFLAARDQRWAVEAAREEGAPLSVDRGQPVDMADLDANSAPVRAYEEWGENAPDFARGLRLDKLNSPQDINRALAQIERVNGGFDAARRGRITHAETEALAADLNMKPADLLARKRGQAWNAEEALAARQIVAKAGNEVVNLAKRIQRTDATEQDMAQFHAALLRASAIQEQVAGGRAEAGRALSQFRMVADADAVSGSVLREALAGLGGPDGIRSAARAIIDSADTPKRLNTAIKIAAAPKWRDKLLSLMYFSQLSSPVTHAVNIMGNTMTSLAQLPEMAVTAGVGRIRSMLPDAEQDRVLFSEVGQRAVGWLAGAKEGFANLGHTLRTGETSDAFAKFETPTAQRAFSGPAGVVIDAPMRALAAEDELFKAMARQMDIRGLAMRQARLKEGLSGQQARDRAAELSAEPTEEMLSEAFDYARYVTFQRPLGNWGQKGSAFLNEAWPFRVFVPYLRTPTNLLKFAAERSPIAPLLWPMHRDFIAGGAKRDAAIARWIVGSGATMMAVEAARQGYITGGGPADPKKRALLEADGWQPYSVRIGDAYYSYRRLDPFSTTIGFAADYVDLQDNMSEEEREQTAAILVGSAFKNLSNKTWLSGITGLGEALGDWARYGDNFLAGLAGNVVPGAASAGARVVDPIQRETGDWLSRIRSRIPYDSRNLPPRRNVLGQPVIGFNGGGLAALSPITSTTRRNDPTINALLEAGIGLTKPGKTARDPNTGEKVKLTPEQYSEFQRLTGDRLRPELQSLVGSPVWEWMNPEEREKAVGNIVRDARKAGRVGMFGRRISAAR